jgi:MoxR-like ATPase
VPQARIVILDGDLLGRNFIIPQGRIITVGRDDVADVVIPHPSISKIHASFELRGDQLVVSDRESTNGIRLNGERIRQAALNDQSIFAIGDIQLRFESGEELADTLREFKARTEGIMDELRKRIVGQEEVLQQLLACIFAGGHALMVGVPGLAKTVTVNSLAQALDLSFRRVQFTPDLMPSDITGTTILQDTEEGRRFKFVEGPVFTQLLLADEINRTPPKTQASLLEAMQERQVTAGDRTLKLPQPFVVIATQNPIEQEGTYVLPEAQLDRFMFNIAIDYPSRSEEEEILRRTTSPQESTLRKVMHAQEILMFQRAVRQVETSSLVISYAARLVRATRLSGEDSDSEIRTLLEWGAGPRAGQYLLFGAKSFAAMQGRAHATCADVRRAAMPVLRHRISTNFQAQARGVRSDDVIKLLLERIKEPEMPKFV